MKSKHICYWIIIAASLAFAPQFTKAQGVTLRKGITQERIKRNDQIQRKVLITIFSQVAPVVGMSETQLLCLLDSGVIKLQMAPLGKNGAQLVSTMNNGTSMGTIRVPSNAARVLLAGNYHYELNNHMLNREAVACTIFVQITTPRIECYSDQNVSGSVIKFSTNVFQGGMCVTITGPGAPTGEIPWTTNDFVSPIFPSIIGASYTVVLNYCGGGRAFPFSPGYAFPYSDAVVIGPDCRIAVDDDWQIDTWNPHTDPRKKSETANSEVVIYPNPASMQLSVRFAASDGSLYGFQIIDLVGKAYPAKIQESTDNEVNLDISDLLAGTYLLQLTMSNGNILTKRFQKYE